MSRKDDLIVGLDIGTTKICAVVAERTETGVDVVGIGTHPSRGLRKGLVVHPEATIEVRSDRVTKVGGRVLAWVM